MDSLSLDQNHAPLIRTATVYCCISKQQLPPTDGFTMTTTSKGWIDGGARLATTNNQHAPNRYLKVHLIEYNICKIYACYSP